MINPTLVQTRMSRSKKKPRSSGLEAGMRILFFLAACLCAAAILMICLFVLAGGWPAIQEIGIWNFLTGSVWQPTNNKYGLLPMIAATFSVTLLALVIAVPSGIFTAVFLCEFCPEKLKKWLLALTTLMAGIPSVVYGFFGLMVLVPWIRTSLGGSGRSMLAAGLILGLMILPTIITVSRSSIAAVPRSYYHGSIALGASHERSVYKTVVPAAKRGILSGVILGMGRAAGETMAVVMVAGNQAVMPASLLQGVRTLTANIVMEMGYAADLHYEALIASAGVLLVFILVINLAFNLIQSRSKKA